MEKNIINPDEIIQKARNIIENKNQVEKLSQEEEKWLEENCGIIYVAYRKALELKNDEIGGIDCER